MRPSQTSLFRSIAAGDLPKVSAQVAAHPEHLGAGSKNFFLAEITHQVYAGDTALHIAAAAFQIPIARLLVRHGADCRAKNRLGAEPLHYAADANHWDPVAQARTIVYLLKCGADPNAVDRFGVTPLHRAVRTRSLAAVEALLAGGANPLQPNGRGSTPLQLAMHNTGRSGSGSARAREQQAGIVDALKACGASLTL
jgi:ankyrin repeat protein